ncbi:helix-turn-helix domain-containing protein [Actinomadura barringtoniae]|uniref:Helix-turn-helix domain-containing protein n=1 Tax=Actinomadura barringtoniae TaxID=1427535 RepID=A0A939PFN4_9ACTN|nr:helix-turn-helix transcriptional regulator [Actinomadura barringtoniae]MBO2451423.1 helix-turn-helix domain-containing protein [Actinomadura barringtoniae]
MSNSLDPDRSLWHVIAIEVRRQRELHGLSETALARALDCNRSTVSRIENGLRRLSAKYAATLDELWQTRLLFTRLVAFANATDDGDWFTGLKDYEARATRIKMWELSVVPGLLQTPDYARAVLSAGLVSDVDRELEKRLSRQAAVFEKPKPPHISVILNWVVLEQPFGGPDVMRGQLARLLEVADLSNVSVRVLEKGAGDHMGVEGPFKLLTVDDRDIAYTDAPTRGRLILEPPDVQYLSVGFDRIGDIAATVRPSRALIEGTMETYQ